MSHGWLEGITYQDTINEHGNSGISFLELSPNYSLHFHKCNSLQNPAIDSKRVHQILRAFEQGAGIVLIPSYFPILRGDGESECLCVAQNVLGARTTKPNNRKHS